MAASREKWPHWVEPMKKTNKSKTNNHLKQPAYRAPNGPQQVPLLSAKNRKTVRGRDQSLACINPDVGWWLGAFFWKGVGWRGLSSLVQIEHNLNAAAYTSIVVYPCIMATFRMIMFCLEYLIIIAVWFLNRALSSLYSNGTFGMGWNMGIKSWSFLTTNVQKM